jgi:hypothetical protein
MMGQPRGGRANLTALRNRKLARLLAPAYAATVAHHRQAEDALRRWFLRGTT